MSRSDSVNEHNRLNLMRALREVRRRGIAHSGHIADVVGLGPSRANTVITALRNTGLIAVNRQSKLDGRHAITLRGDVGCIVGVDMTLDLMTVAVSDLEYRLLNDPLRTTQRVPITPWETTLDIIATTIARELERSQGDRELMGIGVGLPGPVQRQTGTPESDHLLHGWRGVPIGEELENRLIAANVEAPQVVVGNDASLGALGVVTRAAWGNPSLAPNDIVYVRVTHGIGMGLIIKGHLVTGADGYAGEIGHVRVLPDGPPCTRCNRRGCLEVLASEKAVVDALRKHAWTENRKGPRTGRDVIRIRDARTDEEVGRAAWNIGFVLAAAANVLNPAWIVLGGTLTDMPSFREHFNRTLRAYALPQAVEHLRIATWTTIFSDEFASDRDRDVGKHLSPELLGALAFVIDECGDKFFEAKVANVTI